MNKKGESQKNHRIQVFARCRPLNSNERKRNSQSVVDVKSEKEITLKDRNTNRDFLFDEVFPPNAKQIDVYKSVVAPLITEVLNGYNCTVFAYGQTGTGKTYTMEGERSDCQCSWEEDPQAGVIPRSLHQLFEKLNEEENVEFSVRVSFLELYNEELIDLLSINPPTSEITKLRLFEDTTRKGSVIIQGLNEVIVNNKNEVYSILEKGTSRRQTATTLLNAASSRSHTVFSVTVHIKENTIDGEELLKTGKLNLVDLAGSENVGRSGAIEKRAREAGSINQSLLTLGRVITALIEKQPHIPYRESKLTRLLQDSLGGHTKTSIIATVSPALCNFDETYSTLEYATKAKSITIRPEANKKMTKRALIREYTEEIEQLKKDLDAQRSKDGIYVHPDNYESMQREITDQLERIKKLSEQIEKLVEENNTIEQIFTSTKEELGKTCEILDKTTKKYEETATELSNKKEVLAYTQEVLSKTTLERDEKQYLINIHKNTEKKLSNQALTLLQVADETTSDVDKLHEKIGRKEIVENTNERLCHEFRKMAQLQFAKLDDLVSQSKDEQVEGLNCIANQSDIFFSELEKQKETLSNLLYSMSQEQVKCDALGASLNSQTTEKRQLVGGLQHENDSRKDQYIAELQDFLMKVLPKHLTELQANQTKMEEWFHNQKKVLDEKISNFNKTIVEQAEKQKELVESTNRVMESFHAHNDKLLDELYEQLDSISNQNEFDELVTVLNNHLLGYHKNIVCKANKVKETSSSIKKNSAGLQIVNDSQLNLQLRINEAESNQLNLKEVDQIINVEEFSAQKGSSLQTMTNLSADASNTIKNLQQIIADDHEKCKKSLEDLDSKLVKEQESNNHTVNVLKSSLSQIMDKYGKGIKEKNESVWGIAKKVWDLAKESKNKLVSVTAKVKDEILKRDLEFEKFVTDDLVKDIPTGTTPQRKTFVYPKVLAATSPDERILQRYRSQLAVNTELAVSTPLDNSFHESPESKLSPIEESGKLNSDSTSFTTEDCESAGCDSDSNSSTMSDTGESYKNKENCRSDKKSRLPKRHKFLVPAPPHIRKPLFSNNSDVCLN